MKLIVIENLAAISKEYLGYIEEIFPIFVPFNC